MNDRGKEHRPKVSVVIPSWNQAGLLNKCLQSVMLQENIGIEILVVDDASTDGTATMLAQNFPEVRCLRLETNQGFAVAANTGLRAAQGSWILLLNNDVRLAPDFLEEMLRCADQTQAQMIAPLLLWEDSPDRVYSMGDRITVGARPEAIGFRDPLDRVIPPTTIFGATGAASLFHRDLFDRVGLLDESFIAYFEDADLCYRARLAGFEAALAMEARAWHVGSASIAGKTWWRSAQCYRNHALLLIKNTPWPLVMRYAFPLMRERAHQGRMLITAGRAEFGLLRALILLLKMQGMIWRALPGALCARRRIQRNRRISISALRNLLRKETP